MRARRAFSSGVSEERSWDCAVWRLGSGRRSKCCEQARAASVGEWLGGGETGENGDLGEEGRRTRVVWRTLDRRGKSLTPLSRMVMEEERRALVERREDTQEEREVDICARPGRVACAVWGPGKVARSSSLMRGSASEWWSFVRIRKQATLNCEFVVEGVGRLRHVAQGCCDSYHNLSDLSISSPQQYHNDSPKMSTPARPYLSNGQVLQRSLAPFPPLTKSSPREQQLTYCPPTYVALHCPRASAISSMTPTTFSVSTSPLCSPCVAPSSRGFTPQRWGTAG